MLNKVILIGRLGAAPELKYFPNGGSAMCRFRVATDDSYTDREGQRVERTEWHNVVTFNKQAETCNNFLGKGSLVYVEGSLQTRKWEDGNGQNHFMTEIRAQRVLFLDRKSDSYGQGEEGARSGGQPFRRQQGVDEDKPWENASQYQENRSRQSQRSYNNGGNGGRESQPQRNRAQSSPYEDEMGGQGEEDPFPPRGGSESDIDKVPF